MFWRPRRPSCDHQHRNLGSSSPCGGTPLCWCWCQCPGPPTLERVGRPRLAAAAGRAAPLAAARSGGG
eukprot:2646002-Pyramimonas_sp.AAC.1